MKISFPYIGCVTGYKKLLQWLGHEVVMPNKPTQKTIELGVKYSPEFICIPFKVMMGTYIEAAQAGAKVIISSGGHGPCRAGLYGEIHQRILKSLGYDVEVIIFDSMFRDFKKFYRNLKKVTNNVGTLSLLKHLWHAYRIIHNMDNMEKKIKRLRAYEQNRGEFNRVWNKIQTMYSACTTGKDVKVVTQKAYKMLAEVPIKEVAGEEKIRIGIIGEIYVVMESSVNMDIEQKLNSMGVEVENVQYISNWINHNIRPKFMGGSKAHQVIKKGERFVKKQSGGHDKENVGWIVDFNERGFDAVVHLMPFGCLPELITQTAIPTIAKELDMPILSLSLDEQMGTANNQTRIEAFVDLVRSKKLPKMKHKIDEVQDWTSYTPEELAG